MPIIKSAKKRVRVAERAAIRNSKTKRSLKTALKTFRAKLTGDTHAKAMSALDTAVKKGLMHKNKAARQKAQLAAAAKTAGTKSTTQKSSTAKAAPAKKTTAAKKATTAKAAPKAAAKKTAVKKPTTKK